MLFLGFLEPIHLLTDSTDFRDQVRARTDIAEVVGESIALAPRRGGAEFVGLCPFHPDHNPSLHVYPDRQSFRCWVCDEGGDVFSFVMKHEGVTFPQALDLLAERAGLERPKQSGGGSQNHSIDKPRLLDVLAWADRQFRSCLKAAPEAAHARDYVNSRGISAAMVEQFGLGFHPPDWQWLQARARGTYTPADLTAAGLVRPRSSGPGLRDEFYGRVLFPIRNERGRPVAFGGRVLPGAGDEAGPKYLNSGDSPVFSKSKLVYALDVARPAIAQQKTAVVMEGYTDCIAAHQHGHANVVATLGTALAESHVALLKRFAQTVVLVFDGDRAGLDAAERALVRFLAQDVDLRILTLPAGLDPADFLAKDTNGEFAGLLAHAPSALEFKLTAAINRFGLKSEYGPARVIADVLQTVAAAPRLAGTPKEDVVLRKLADGLRVPERSIREELKKVRSLAAGKPTPAVRNPAPPAPKRVPDDPAEREVLAAVLTRPDLFDHLARQVGPDDFRTPRLRDLYEYCRDVSDLHGPPAYDLLMSQTDDPALKQLLAGLDGDARRKDLVSLLGGQTGLLTEAAGLLTEQDQVDDSGPDAFQNPDAFQKIVNALVRRRDGRRLERDQSRLARQLANGGPLDDAAKARLRQFQEKLATRHLP